MHGQGSLQYPIRRLHEKSCVPKTRVWWLKLLYRFEIWQELMLSRRMLNVRAIYKFKVQIMWRRVFMRSYRKKSYPVLERATRSNRRSRDRVNMIPVYMIPPNFVPIDIRPLSEPVMTWFIDAHMRYSVLKSWHTRLLQTIANGIQSISLTRCVVMQNWYILPKAFHM